MSGKRGLGVGSISVLVEEDFLAIYSDNQQRPVIRYIPWSTNLRNSSTNHTVDKCEEQTVKG